MIVLTSNQNKKVGSANFTMFTNPALSILIYTHQVNMKYLNITYV